MREFLIEIEGCLYDNPEDVVAEFAKLRAEVEKLKDDLEWVEKGNVEWRDLALRNAQEAKALRDLIRRANSFITYSSEWWPTELKDDIDAALAARGE